jgi:hypothetical protein
MGHSLQGTSSSAGGAALIGNWRDDLILKLEDFVDTFVMRGAKATDVYDAIQNELDRLRVAYDRDPDPADDQSDDVVEEASNDWPASQT